MSITVTTIEGRRDSICQNDAFSVVAGNRSLTIIPAADLPGKTRRDVLKAFRAAAAIHHEEEKIVAAARQTLGL